MIKLFNSTVCPQEGVYSMSKIEEDVFVGLLNSAIEVESYIGYDENLEHLKNIGVKNIPKKNREQAELQEGDIILVMKLGYRFQNPELKNNNKSISESEWRYFIMYYKENKK